MWVNDKYLIDQSSLLAMPDHVDTILVHAHKSILIYMQLSHLLPSFLFSLQILLEELLVKPENQK